MVLHRVKSAAMSPRFALQSLRLLSTMPQVTTVLHDLAAPAPAWLKRLDFDAIVLDSSALGYRWGPRSIFDGLRKDWEFVADLRALKIAFPMDEYACSALLDDWLADLRVDLVGTTLFAHRQLLIPKCCRCAEVVPAWTAVLDEELRGVARVPLQVRPIDIGYRAKRVPYNFGRIGQLKTNIGNLFVDWAKGHDLVTDVAVGDAFRIDGEAWLGFLQSCRCVLGAPSGSSVHDPVGSIARSVREFIAKHPEAAFEVVEQACFPGVDGDRAFTVLSPRVLEAASAGCCQILVRGDYGGLLRPGEHYVPLEADGSNVHQVVASLSDVGAATAMAERCRERLLAEPSLRAEMRDRQLYEWICERRRPPESGRSVAEIRAALDRFGGTTTAALRRRQLIDRTSFYFHRLQGRLPAPLGSGLLRMHRLIQSMRGL